MITVTIFCDHNSISDRDRWVLEKMYGNSEKTQDEWVKELQGKIVFSLPKISTFAEVNDTDKKNRTNNKK